jgi:hypothetical protein
MFGAPFSLRSAIKKKFGIVHLTFDLLQALECALKMDTEWIVQRITDPFEEGGVFISGKLTYRTSDVFVTRA